VLIGAGKYYKRAHVCKFAETLDTCEEDDVVWDVSTVQEIYKLIDPTRFGVLFSLA